MEENFLPIIKEVVGDGAVKVEVFDGIENNVRAYAGSSKTNSGDPFYEIVDLGCGIMVQKGALEKVERQTRDSIYVKDLAVLIWGEEELSRSSITGNSKYNRNTMSPDKLIVLKDMYEKHLLKKDNDRESINIKLGKVNHILSEKINDLSRKKKLHSQKPSPSAIEDPELVEFLENNIKAPQCILNASSDEDEDMYDSKMKVDEINYLKGKVKFYKGENRKKLKLLSQERAKNNSLQEQIVKLSRINCTEQKEIYSLVTELLDPQRAAHNTTDLPIIPPTPRSSSSDSNKLKNGESMNSELVDLGAGIKVLKYKFNLVKDNLRDSMFVKDLAALIWGHDELMKSSIKGISRSEGRTILCPEKLAVIRNIYKQRLVDAGQNTELIALKLKQVNRHITEKIGDLRRGKVKRKRSSPEEVSENFEKKSKNFVGLTKPFHMKLEALQLPKANVSYASNVCEVEEEMVDLNEWLGEKILISKKDFNSLQ